MGAIQLRKMGKLGNLMAWFGVLLLVMPAISLFYGSLGPFGALAIAGVGFIVAGYLIARNDPYTGHRWWRIFTWNPTTNRDRVAQRLVMLGYFMASPMIIIFNSRYSSSNFGLGEWTLVSAAVAGIITGWVLVLTGHDELTPTQEPTGNISST